MNFPHKNILVLIIILVLFGFTSSDAYSQAVPHSLDVRVVTIPKSPGPLTRVILRLESFALDLDRSNVSWRLDGVLKLSGIGEKSFSFTTRDVGSQSTVSVSVVGELGTVNKTISFVPAEVVLLWESTDSYTPPFYKGKALPSSGSIMKIVAVPRLVTTSGNRLSADGLVYTWKKNSRARDFNTQSGRGENTILYRKDFLEKNESIEVSVSSFGGSINANGRISVQDEGPEIVFYEDHPLEGIKYERSGDRFVMTDREATLVAEPYFFSSNKRGENLSFDWKVAKKKVVPGKESGFLTLRPEGGSGNSILSLEVKHLSELLQFMKKSLTINFGG